MLLVNLAMGSHEANVSLSPTIWGIGREESVKLTVENSEASNHSIIKIELFVPTEEDVSVYEIAPEFEVPLGWEKPRVSYKEGLMSIIFSSESEVGIMPGSTEIFTLASVKAPSKVGEWVWKWVTTDPNNETQEDDITTKTKLGALSYFVIEVPNETKANKEFNASIIGYDEYKNIKTDYTGTINIESTDPKAIFPESINFSLDDKGEKKIIIIYKTPGNQTFTVKDEETGVEKTSDQTFVIPAVPSKLSILINEDESSADKVSVTLSLQAEDAEECRYSNEGITWSEWEAYNTAKDWNLAYGDGTKIVYYQCKNEIGESKVVSDTILLVTVPVSEVLSWIVYTGPVALAISLISLGLVLSRTQKRRKEEKS